LNQVVYIDCQFVYFSFLSVESTENIESIRQSYVNTVNELNQELLAMKERCEQLDEEKQFLNSELEKRSADANQERVQETTGKLLSWYMTLKSEIYLF
jgi:hypothetical protein